MNEKHMKKVPLKKNMRRGMKRVVSALLSAVMVVVFMPSIPGMENVVPVLDVHATQSKSDNFDKGYSLNGNPGHDIAAIALKQLGKTGRQLGYTEDWCADFVNDCAKLAGQSNAIYNTANVSNLYSETIKKGGKVVTSPQVGDLAFPSGSNSHVEIVYEVSGSTVRTIGGNCGGTGSLYTNYVRQHTNYYTRYIRPNYTQSKAAKELRDKVVKVAYAEEGYLEKATAASLYDKYANKGSNNYTKYWQDMYGYPGGPENAWCALFVAWCMKQANVPKSIYNWDHRTNVRAAVYTDTQQCIDSGTLYTSFDSKNIQPGDVVFYSYGHMGIIYKVEGNKFWTIEGNSSDQVRIRDNPSDIKYFVHIDYSGCSGKVRFGDAAGGSGGSSGGGSSYKNSNASANPDDHTVPTRQLYYKSGYMTGDEVCWVQAMCNKLAGKNLAIDGIFGSQTRDAVKDFQRANGLAVDGIVGPNTINKMKQLWESKKVVNVTSVSLSAGTIQSTVGYTDKLSVSISPSNATNKSISWSSSNTGVATVSDGTVKGISEGEATITAKASNGVSASCKVYVHKENVITFVKDDGTVLSVQKVRYGGSATAPKDVTKVGHTFSTWQGTYQNVKEDATVTAVFTRNKYKVTFAETNGTKIGTVQTVAYDDAATAPSESDLHIPAGYTFEGWSDKFDHIASDMTIYPVYTWADSELPLAVEATEETCVVSTSKGVYTLNFAIKNHSEEDRKARVMTYMTTNAGKLIAQGETRTVIIPAAHDGVDGELQINNMYVTCEQTAERVRIVVLDDYESAVPLAEIKDVDVYLAGYGPWVDTKPEGDAEFQTRTVYHSKNVSYTTSSSSALTGWTKYDTKSTTTETRKNDRQWYGSGVSSNPPSKTGSNIQRTWAEAKSNAGYNLWNYTKPTYNISISSTGGDSYRSMVRWIQCALCICGKYTDIDGVYGYNTANVVKDFQREKGLAVDGIVGEATRQKLQEAADNAHRYDYYYETKEVKTNYTYYYYKVDEDWSEWKDEAIVGDTTVNPGKSKTIVETKTQYRVKQPAVNNDGTALTPDCTLPDGAGDLAGKDAVVIVFKNKVNQIAEDNVEYIGNTKVGTDGSLNISFVPREEISYENTGDYTVVLGVKGTTNYVKVGTIEAPKPSYKVTFIDGNGEEISSEEVTEGHDATVPEVPEMDGYTFVGWDTGVTNIHANLTITAQYEVSKCMVTYVDWLNKKIETKEVEYGSYIEYPENPEAPEGMDFVKWSIEAGSKVTENTVCEAVYEKSVLSVKFVDDEGKEVYTQEVGYGESAVAPAVVYKDIEEGTNIPESIEGEKDGKEFVSWGEDIDLSNVKTNLIVGAIYRYQEDTACPWTTVSTGEYASAQTVEFKFSSDASGVIYYTLDGSNPAEFENPNVIEYTEPIVIDKTCILTYYAVSMGYNDSAIGKEYYVINTPGNKPQHIVDIITINEFDSTVVDGAKAFVDDGTKINAYDLLTEQYESVELEGIYYDLELTDKWIEGAETVTEGLTLYARYIAKQFEVTYLDEDGTEITKGMVDYGMPADASIAPEKDGYRFAGWTSDDDADSIKKDTVVKAHYVTNEEYVIINFSRESYSIMEGSSYKLTAKTKYDATGLAAKNEVIEWSVSDKGIATIDENGIVTGIKAGTVVVTARLVSNGEMATCEVNITPNPENAICLYSNSTYKIVDGYLREIKVGQNTVGEVKKQINASDLNIIDIDGLKLSDDETVGTGTRIQMLDEDGTLIDQVIVIITGDYNGDGMITGQDVSGLSRALLEKEVASSSQLAALDLNGDGFVNNRDAAMLARYLVGKEKL